MNRISRSFQLLFIVSGVSGLVYETIWARYLGLLLGHASDGQLLTLMIYMGGIGIGSFMGARVLGWIRKPLLAYAMVELAICVLGLAYHDAFLHGRELLLDSGILAGMTRIGATSLSVALGAVLTLPPAILLGMTYPLATSGLMRIQKDGGKDSIARLYFANSLGAAAGALLASYFLIPFAGTPGALAVAASLNGLVAITSWFLSRKADETPAQEASPAPEFPAFGKPEESAPPAAIPVLLLLAISLLTGFSSFLYEIGWTRYLAFLLGSSTHAFDIMLSAFILGLALGGWHVHRNPSTGRAALRRLFIAQALMGGAAVLSILGYHWIFTAGNALNLILRRTDEAYLVHSLFQFLFSAVVMCPASFFAGMTLPLITGFLCSTRRKDSYTGTVYGWNTLGSILGAGVGGIVLMPHLGLSNLIICGAILDIALALLLLRYVFEKGRPRALAPAFLGIILVIGAFFVREDDRLVLGGVFRLLIKVDPEERVTRIDGRTATISIHEFDGLVTQKTNGKTDASINTMRSGQGSLDELTQDFLAWLGMAYRQRPYRAGMIGLGSGMTAHRLLADTRMTKLDVVEIEPAVWQLSSKFQPFNARIFSDPRFDIHFQDARTYFATQAEPYDLILSEPSNPWVSGVSSLFTTEFYQEIRRHLARDGMLIQWLQLYEFDSDLFLSIMAALRETFPFVRIHAIPGHWDVFIVASSTPPVAEPGVLARIADSSVLRGNGLVPTDVSSGSVLLTEASLGTILSGRNANSEFFTIVDNGAEKALFTERRVQIIPALLDGSSIFYQDLLEPLPFQQRRDAFLDLRRRRMLPRADPNDTSICTACAGSLTTGSRARMIEDALHKTAPAWSWTVGTREREISSLIRQGIQNDSSRTFQDLIFLLGYHGVHGQGDSLEHYRRLCLGSLPPSPNLPLLRELLLLSVRAGDSRAAMFVRERIRLLYPMTDESELHLLDMLIANQGSRQARRTD